MIKAMYHGKVKEFASREEALEYFAFIYFYIEDEDEKRIYGNVLKDIVAGKSVCTSTNK